MELKDRVILITGAGSGLGAAVAERVIADGGNAILLDVNVQAGEAKAASLGKSALFIRADVTTDPDAEAAIASTLATFGRLDGLVNCAGVAPAEKIIGHDGPHRLGSFVQTVSINLIGTFNMLRLAADAMSKQDADEDGCRGVIINTASIAGQDGQIGQAAYAASKGGVMAMTLPAARELARYGIRVVTIAPGIFGTPMLTSMPQEVQDKLGASVPFPARLGRPEEYADLVSYVFKNQMLNGEVIRLDGALRMAPK